MIAYLLRTLPVGLRASLRRRRYPVSRLKRRVSLRQIDLNRHMNQAQYLAVMEIGRVDLLIGNGAWRAWQSAGINPVVAKQTIQYRRELKPLQRYVIDSRITGIDGRLLLLEHHLVIGRQVHAKGVVELIFVGPDGVMSAEAVAEVAAEWLTDGLPVNNWRVTA